MTPAFFRARKFTALSDNDVQARLPKPVLKIACLYSRPTMIVLVLLKHFSRRDNPHTNIPLDFIQFICRNVG